VRHCNGPSSSPVIAMALSLAAGSRPRPSAKASSSMWHQSNRSEVSMGAILYRRASSPGRPSSFEQCVLPAVHGGARVAQKLLAIGDALPLITAPSPSSSYRRRPRSSAVSQSARRPPPARRMRLFGSGSASRSSSPRLIVERASPVSFETAARPPRPAVRTSAAANNALARRAVSPPRSIAAEWRPHRSCDRLTPVRRKQESPGPESIRRITGR
jgi:hypothetical protein